MWKTMTLANGYVLYTRPARVPERPASFMPYVEVDGVAYQFQKDGKWVGQGVTASFRDFEKDGATLHH
jgi:hypothetical protein